MKNRRRHFLKMAGLTGLGVAGSGMVQAFASGKGQNIATSTNTAAMDNQDNDKEISIIGLYGQWADTLRGNNLPTFSFRRKEWQDIEAWRKAARQRLTERLAIPGIAATPPVKINRQFEFDGLHIEELSWQLPYGRPTAAMVLKPAGAKGRLPGILAFHDHGGNKYFGCRKITRTSPQQHPMMNEHQDEYYGGLAWANEVAKRGYVVLVPDAFTFASRRVMLQDVPLHMRNGHTDENPEDAQNIRTYNTWAGEHEHVMAKSLFCAGTTWPGVFFAEDRKALDILCTRADVDINRIGCGGLSGGGIRTVFMGGLDERIKCAVDIGFMSTWNDFLLNKSYTHTWMTYVPLLPAELDFPEILGLRAPLPTLVLNDIDDTLYTLPEMKKAETILTEVFSKAGAAERFRCSYYPGPHKFDMKMQAEAFNWFDRWLK